MKICKFLGCNRKHKAKGYCTKHYQRFRVHGDPSVVHSSRFRNGHKLTQRANNWNWKGGPIKCNCIVCNKEFYRYFGKLNKNNNNFCSPKCAGVWMSINSIGEKSRRWNGGKIKINCIVCGKEIRRCLADIKRGYNKFCSLKCMGIWMSENNCCEKSPGWQGGKSFEPYGLDFNKKLKEFIRERDSHKCKECGVPEIECFRKLDIHHIDYNKKNNDPKNLISLCHHCHLKTNANREYWKLYLNIEIKRSAYKC